MQAIINNRTYQITGIVQVEGLLVDDMKFRGWEPVFYEMLGKRGATFIAYRGIRSGQFVKA
jgi:hypothetical protein